MTNLNIIYCTKSRGREIPTSSGSVLQIRVNQRSLTHHIYHVMIIVTGGFFNKSFYIIIFRSNCMQLFFKTDVTRNFAIFTGKHLCCSLFLIKLQAIWHFNLVKNETSKQVIPVNIAKFLQTAFLMEHLC